MIKWDENYSVGVETIDNQHKELFHLFNQLLDAMKNGKANTIIRQIVLDLEKYAIFHFQKEEFFFRRFNYEGFAKHIAEHQFFIEKIAALKKDLNSKNFMLSIELMNFMKDWIEHHILVIDKLYSDCFRQNGLK